MTARKRRNRPARQRPGARRPTTAAPDSTQAEQNAEPEATTVVGEGEVETEPPESGTQNMDATEAVAPEPDDAEPQPDDAEPQPEAAVPEPEPAEPQAAEPELEEDSAEPSEPEVAQPKTADSAPEPAEPQAGERHAEALKTDQADTAAAETEETTAEVAVGEEPDRGEPEPHEEAPSGWRVLAKMGKPRLTKANLFATVLAAGLGFAVVAQVQQTQNAGLESLREDELVRILDDFTQDNLRLSDEIRELESTRDRLISGAGTSSEALAAARERADALGILAGTRPARGEGIELTIADPSGKITAPLLLDALEELRDAGAEAIQIGGIRVVASSYFTDVDGGIELSGQRLERPYTIFAIGDSSTLASAMKIPGGVVDTVQGKDGIASISEKSRVDITALHAVDPPQYAQPVPSPTAS